MTKVIFVASGLALGMKRKDQPSAYSNETNRTKTSVAGMIFILKAVLIDIIDSLAWIALSVAANQKIIPSKMYAPCTKIPTFGTRWK
jgi:hypothetical protein